MSPQQYDVFFSYRSRRYSKDPAIQALLARLESNGIRTWIDETGIGDGQSIPEQVIDALSKSKLVLSYYTTDYSESPICQWELMTAYLAGQRDGSPGSRIVVTCDADAGLEHVHPVELVRDKIAPVTQPQRIVEVVKERLAVLTSRIGEPRAPAACGWIPERRRIHHAGFVGRIAELWQVHTAVHQSDFAVSTGKPYSPALIQGLGGMGKTLLAAEYASRFAAAHQGGVVWLSAAEADSAEDGGLSSKQAQLAVIASEIGLFTEGLSPDEVEAAVWRKLSKDGKPCLIVVDDLPHGLDATLLRQWQAPPSVGRTLITTRSRGYNRLFSARVALSGMLRKDAVRLLTAQRPPASPTEADTADAICALLGDHPLAIDVTASSLRESTATTPYATLQNDLERPSEDELEQATKLVKELGEQLPAGHEVSIARTLMSSIARLSSAGGSFLALAAVLASAPIDDWLASKSLAAVSEGGASKQAAPGSDYAHDVLAHSLAEPIGHDRALQVHALVARTVRFRQGETRLQRFRKAAVDTLLSELPPVRDVREHSRLADGVVHARHLADTVTRDGLQLMGHVARYEQERGDYQAASRTRRRQWAGREQLLGAGHRDTLASKDIFGETLFLLGELDDARRIQRDVLDASARLLGPDDDDTLICQHNLANTMQALGELDAALALYEKTLESRKRLVGPSHPELLTCQYGVATVLADLGRLSEARALHESVLTRRQERLGLDHPDTISSLHGLASAVRAAGDVVGAMQMQRQLVEVRERVLGSAHPDTLATKNNLASTLRALGQLDDARTLQEEVSRETEEQFGHYHPNAILSKSNLSHIASKQGDWFGACTLLEEALTAAKQVWPEGHPHTLTLMNKLAVILLNLGRVDEAVLYMDQVLDARTRLLGAEHPDTLITRHNLGAVHHQQGDLVTAMDAFTTVLETRLRVLGQHHPHTTVAAWSLFRTLIDMELFKQAGDIANEHLRWLLRADSSQLTGDQRAIRQSLEALPDGLLDQLTR